MRVDEALAAARERGVDRLDARLLLAHALQVPAAWPIAHPEARLETPQAAAWQSLLARRAAGEPLAYLVGTKEFHGALLDVDARVLVPRPDTETLVEWAIELARAAPGAPLRVVDLGTGSGAIVIALARALGERARLVATDRSASALDLARHNAERLGAEVDFRRGDWWDAVPQGLFELAVSNPPYVAESDPHLATLGHEPREALVAGRDGLADLRPIVAGAPRHLSPGGWLLVEHGDRQAQAVRELLAAAGFEEIVTRCDLAGRPRASGGRRPDPAPRTTGGFAV